MSQPKGIPIIILFNTDASHSFISSASVYTLELNVERLSRKLRVTIPVGRFTLVTYVCLNLKFEL